MRIVDLRRLMDRLHSCVLNDWRRYGMRGSAMAQVAGHFTLPFKILLIDGEHHLHHLPRHLFGFLIILLRRPFHVTKTALHPKRGSYELHCRDQSVCRNTFQDLNVLVLFVGHRGSGGCCRVRARLFARQ